LISEYLSRPIIQTILGVDPSVTGNFSSCSNRVGTAFNAALDEFHPTYHYVAALLERDVRVLIYVGKNDWICNWVGNERWTLALEWSGGDAFRREALRDWKVGGKAAGSTRSKGGLTFATIEGAGHMVRVGHLAR
jgi:cathepsin A (carboxypeptidase C)